MCRVRPDAALGRYPRCRVSLWWGTHGLVRGNFPSLGTVRSALLRYPPCDGALLRRLLAATVPKNKELLVGSSLLTRKPQPRGRAYCVVSPHSTHSIGPAAHRPAALCEGASCSSHLAFFRRRWCKKYCSLTSEVTLPVAGWSSRLHPPSDPTTRRRGTCGTTVLQYYSTTALRCAGGPYNGSLSTWRDQLSPPLRGYTCLPANADAGSVVATSPQAARPGVTPHWELFEPTSSPCALIPIVVVSRGRIGASKEERTLTRACVGKHRLQTLEQFNNTLIHL